MEGYLHKWTNLFSGWKERYFILKNDSLYYFLLKGEEPRGKFVFTKKTQVIPDKENELKFEINTGSGEVIFLQANTPNEREAWVKSIIKGIGESKERNTENNNNLATEENQTNKNEEKMTKKLLKIKMQFDRISYNNEQLENVIKKYEGNKNQNENLHNEVKAIYESNRETLHKMNQSLEEVQSNFSKFYSDFAKFADIFLDQNHHNQLNNNFIFGETHRSSNLKENEMVLANKYSDKLKTFKSNDSHIFNVANTEVIQEDTEIYYGTQEDESPDEYQEKVLNIVKKVKGQHAKPNDMEIFANSNTNKVNSIYNDPAYKKKRTAYPIKKRPFPFNVWQILKDAVGKDLSKFCVPVYFNEPLSLLQRLCENFQYADSLNNAGNDPNPYKRLAYVAGFCMGGYSMHESRTLKPFNPLLGETYEYIDDKMNFRYFGEQVSHHPPISACFAESDVFTVTANSHAKSKLSIMRGSLEFHPAGRTFVTFKKFNEIVSFTKPRACVRGLIIGKMRVDCYGKILVKNHTTDDFCELEIIEEGIFSSKDKGKVIGGCYDKDKNLRLKVEGNWRTHLDVLLPDSEGQFTIKERIWKQMPIGTEPGKEEGEYFLTEFGRNLNNLNEEMKDVLPHTDSRFRPDQRALEIQDIELASSEKHRLEEKQRARRREMEKNHETHKPIYFEESYDELNGELIFKYVRDYWKDREAKSFSHLLDIF